MRPITIERQAHRNVKGCGVLNNDNILKGINTVGFCLHDLAINFEYTATLMFIWLVAIKLYVLGDTMLRVYSAPLLNMPVIRYSDE